MFTLVQRVILEDVGGRAVKGTGAKPIKVDDNSVEYSHHSQSFCALIILDIKLLHG